MSYEIKDKAIIVTGSARGIGQQIVIALLKKGAKIVVSDVMEDVGQQTTQKLQKEYGEDRVIFIRCDVTKEEDLQNLYKKSKEAFGYVDVVVNNAGLLDEIKWKFMFDVNVFGLIRSCQIASEHMSTQHGGKGGVIVNIASVAGIMAGEGSPIYTATKHAVYGYTRSLYLMEGADNIRVNCICPYLAQTKLAKDWEIANRPILQDDLTNQCLSQLLKPEEVAQGVTFLIEDEKNAGKAYKITPFDKWDYYEAAPVLPF